MMIADVAKVPVAKLRALLRELPAARTQDRKAIEDALARAKHGWATLARATAATLLGATGYDGSSDFHGATVKPPFHDITLENAVVEPNKSLVDGGVTYPPVINGTPNAPKILSFDGKRAIQYSVPAGTTATGKERIEHKLAPSTDPNALTFGGRRYTAFDFQIPRDAAAFRSSALFFQEWQGFPYGPPVSLKVTKSDKSPFTIELAVRNMDTGPNSTTPDKVVWTGKLDAGSWHRFVVMTSPNFKDPTGEVKLWIDGTRVADWTGKIGYDPATVPGAQTAFDTKFGLYQPEPNNPHAVYFSDVRFSDNYAAAAP